MNVILHKTKFKHLKYKILRRSKHTHLLVFHYGLNQEEKKATDIFLERFF